MILTANNKLPLQYSIKKDSRQHNKKAVKNVNFSGHFGAEKYAKNRLGYLVHETGFFRDMCTKNFVKKYIEENFKDKKRINLLIGGCSTGEEALTYSMILKNLGKDVKILGFDVSEDAIKQAKSKKFLMQKLCKTPEGYMDISFQYERTLKDSYLAFSSENKLSKQKKTRKALFDDFFKVSDEVPVEPKKSLMQRINNWCYQHLLKIYTPKFESKYVVLKQGKGENCNFVVGDILNLNDIVKNEKYDVITFTNSLYHLITNSGYNNLVRKLNKEAEGTLNKLSTAIRENLNDKGLFVLGEEEVLQTMDSRLVPEIFSKNGLKPVSINGLSEVNVWQKA